MEDQAEKLREQLQQLQTNSQSKTVAVISGKGGVGKSNISLNLAITLKNKGHRVLLFDLDIGMGNIDILMGVSSFYSIADFFTNNVPLNQMITEVPGGIHYISGGTGLSQLTNITKNSFHTFFEQFSILLYEYDYVIFDMDAGMSERSLRFILAVDEVIVVTTCEPTSITDAYAAMKYITIANHTMPFLIIVNRAQSEKEGIDTFNRISRVLQHFLQKKAILLGILPEDSSIPQAVKRQTPFTQFNEKAPASKALFSMVEKYCLQDFYPPANYNKTNFVTRLRRFLLGR
ncbi:MinD/ParA family protein [Bacillus tuaregi]|uniref:MinD/ParA family protein n=1 Tax=Bacillus tuaregi TaxID=1816695 RepID=UPI0008F83A2D|nr:MinD/ParA family protein [Bacillus tuaregi]